MQIPAMFVGPIEQAICAMGGASIGLAPSPVPDPLASLACTSFLSLPTVSVHP